MDEIGKLAAKKTGISTDKASRAVETVLGFLKGGLPKPLSEELEGFFETRQDNTAEVLRRRTKSREDLFAD